MTTLREDQQAWLGGIRSALAAGSKAVLGQAPTGFGKNTVAAVALATAAARGHRPAYVCHREEINLDFVSRLRAAGAPAVRLLMGTHAEGSDAPDAVTVLSVQTLDRRDLHLRDVGLFWWDEAHRAASPSYRRAKARHPAALHVGATATPARADGRPLTTFDVLVPGPQIEELVDAGHLADLLVLSPDEATDALSDDPVTVYPAGRPGVVFASSLDHSRQVAEGLLRRGLRAAHVEADTPNRGDIIEAFNADALDVLCCYRLLTEGVDVPRASVCVLAGRMSSAVAFLQSVGRVRRPAGGRAVLYDLCGSFHLHGHPDAVRRYSLEGTKGIVAVGVDGRPAPVTQCPGCLGWGSPGRCPCGHLRPAPPPPRISKRALKEQWLDRQPREGEAWELWSSLVQTQRERGYAGRWAAIQFMDRTGRAPRWGLRHVPTATATAPEEQKRAS